MIGPLDRWAANGAVRIHYIDCNPPSDTRLPLVVSPGICEVSAFLERLHGASGFARQLA